VALLESVRLLFEFAYHLGFDGVLRVEGGCLASDPRYDPYGAVEGYLGCVDEYPLCEAAGGVGQLLGDPCDLLVGDLPRLLFASPYAVPYVVESGCFEFFADRVGLVCYVYGYLVACLGDVDACDCAAVVAGELAAEGPGGPARCHLLVYLGVDLPLAEPFLEV